MSKREPLPEWFKPTHGRTCQHCGGNVWTPAGPDYRCVCCDHLALRTKPPFETYDRGHEDSIPLRRAISHHTDVMLELAVRKMRREWRSSALDTMPEDELLTEMIASMDRALDIASPPTEAAAPDEPPPQPVPTVVVNIKIDGSDIDAPEHIDKVFRQLHRAISSQA